MDDLQNLGADTIDSQVNSALGYSPKKTVQSATPKYSDFDVNKTYGTPARLLDNLNQTESSGNPYIVQKDTKAMGNYQFLPDTASMLNKQGIKFNAFDPKESRAAADYYIQQLVKQNGGDYNAAMAQYGGIKKTDPTPYLSKVMSGVDVGNQPQQQPQVQQAPSNDPLNNLSGGSIDLAVQSALNEGKKLPPALVAPVKVFNPDADIPTDVGTAPVAPTAQPATNLPAYKMTLQNINVGKNNVAPTSTIEPAYQKAINTANTTNAGDIEQKYVTPAVEAGLALATGATTGLLSGIISTLTPASKEYIDAERKAWKAQNPDLPYNRFEQAFIKGVQAGTFQPKTEGGKQAIAAVSDVLSSLPPTLPGELGALGAEREATTGVAKTLQDQFVSKKTPTPKIEPTIGGVASAGAAATSHEAAINEALSSASPRVQSAFTNEAPSNINLEALNTHKQFDKFDMQPTEGEALQNTSKMSDEWNDRTIDPELQHRFEERNPKLIEGFNKIKEKVSPDVFTENPVELANAPLEKMAKIDKNKLTDIDAAYKNLENANGGTLPLDGKSFVETAEKNLHTKLVTDALPANLKSALKQFSEGRQMTFEDFKMLGTITAAEMRKGGSEAIAAGVVKDALENMQLTPEAAPLKPLLDHAKSLVKQRYDLIDPKKPTYNPAYATAANDTRTEAEIERGDFHPAANTFIAKHYSANTPQVNIQRMLDVIGKDSPEHQALNAAKIDEFKFGSGVKNNNGTIKQEALNKIVYHQNASNLPIMLGNNAVKDLQDLADVARKSEHVRGGPSFANTSNTESVRKRGALGAAKDFGLSAAAKGIEGLVNLKTFGYGGTAIKNMYQGSKEAKALAAAEAERQALSKRRLGPGAGAKLSDIGK